MEQMNLVLGVGLIILGFLFLAAELLIPASGTLFVLAVAAIGVGVVLVFAYDASAGLLTLLVVVVAFPVAGGALLHFWPKTPMGRRMFLTGPQEDATIASMPVHLELETLRGRFGKTVSPLRPSGITDFDGWRVDTITDGIMVGSGEWVRCIEVRAGRVLVRPVDKPDLGNLETADFS
jgi:membrane-bound serine protease (ClpP class)